jgi:hypothetical protein
MSKGVFKPVLGPGLHATAAAAAAEQGQQGEYKLHRLRWPHALSTTLPSRTVGMTQAASTA